MKILFVIGSMSIGGAERSLVNVLSELDPARYEITLLSMQKRGALLEMLPPYVRVLEPPKDLCFMEGSSIRQLLPGCSPKGVFCRLRVMAYKRTHRNLSNYAYRQKKWALGSGLCLNKLPEAFDVAVAFMHSDPSYYVIEKIHAKRKYLWVHNDYSVLNADTAFDEEYFSRADRVVTISDECAEILRRTFPALPDKFMALDNISSEKTVRQMAEGPMPEEYMDGIRILSVGRMTKQKGADLALHAAARLKAQGLSFCWYFLGAGELLTQLKRQAEQLNLNHSVRFLGARSNPYPYIKYAHIVAQTSRFEGKSRVLDEAKMLCRPILATRYQTVGDQLEDGVTGILCDMDPGSIAQSMERLITDHALRDELEQNLNRMNLGTESKIVLYQKLFEA